MASAAYAKIQNTNDFFIVVRIRESIVYIVLRTSTILSGYEDFSTAMNIRYEAKWKISANGQNFCVSWFFLYNSTIVDNWKYWS